MKKKIYTFDIANTALLVLIGLCAFFPIWYVFVISVSDGPTYIADKLHFWPRVVNFGEYARVLKAGDLIRSFGNSALITVCGTVLAMLVTSLAAYALSRKRLRGRKIITPFVLFTMFFSAGLIPYYLLVTGLGLKNTFLALILPGATNAYYMMIMRTYFTGLSDSLEESAKIDGATDMRIFFSIMLPISKPMLAAIGLFFGVQYYNDYFNALLFISSRSMYPLQFLLREMVVNNIANNTSVGGSTTTTAEVFKMASVVLSVLPILMVYPFLQKYFVQGLMLGSVKE